MGWAGPGQMVTNTPGQASEGAQCSKASEISPEMPLLWSTPSTKTLCFRSRGFPQGTETALTCFCQRPSVTGTRALDTLRSGRKERR